MNRKPGYSIGSLGIIFLLVTIMQNGLIRGVTFNSQPVPAAQGAIYAGNFIQARAIATDQAATSFSEMAGLPQRHLSARYLFPWYNNVDLDTQLRFGNVSSSPATVHVYIGGHEMANSPFTLAPGASIRRSFPAINNGPVRIVSNRNIVAAERVIYQVNRAPVSFSEMMGLPDHQLDTTYWFPWYNNVSLDTQLRFGNVSSSPATIHVYIGGREMPGSPFILKAGRSMRKSFRGINNGPVKIESNVNLVSAERVIYKVNGKPASYSEMMGLPDHQLDTTYWFPWYNDVSLDTQLRFGNVSSSPATVHVYIGRREMPGSPFTVAPGTSLRKSFSGVNTGPAKIESDIPIVATERMIYKNKGISTSFSEMMGLPERQLGTTYWLPWYNNADLGTQLRFANVTNTTTAVRVMIGGQEMTGGCTPSNSPYTLAGSASLRVSCARINNGPVQVVSTSGRPILASERVIYRENLPLPGTTYYVSPRGDDSNPGTQTSPWRTIQKAARTVMASDLVYIHGGEYSTEGESPTFKNSGTELNPITLRNYPGEQVVIRLKENPAFFCWWKSTTQGPKVSYVRILATDVAVRTLSNGVTSRKGIVIQGIEGEQISGITAHGCDYWEVGGVDFVDVASGIFSAKQNNRQNVDNSADYWYVHDNRVYGFYRESGMQFNTDDNRIENNEIYKVTDRVDTPYGCQLLNVLGDHNVVRGNVLSRKGSTAACNGIMLEWDLADMNMVEQNLILDVTYGIAIEGGDNNLFRNNVIATNESYTTHKSGIDIVSYDNRSSWPCNEETGSAQVLLPPDDPSHPDYQYYYNPRNCHSTGNQIYNNTIYGFEEGISLYELVGENTIIRNNAIGNWMQDAICFHNPSQRQCYPLPLPGLLADHNVVQEPFGFMEAENLDFSLRGNSPLIDIGLELGTLNPNDFDGNLRPQNQGYDVGAYEYLFIP